jgi:diguanylate cyclase (GGDEF)-like protein
VTQGDGEVVRILYADDNVDHFELFRAVLRSLPRPIDVLHTLSGKETVEILEREEIDLVVLDYRLPDRSGIELLEELAGPDHPPVIMITGEGDEKVAVAAMKGGAYDYIVKDDLLRSELPQAITAALERRDTERTRDEQRAHLAELAFTDPLTGLRNRRFFDESFERELAGARRYGRSLGVMIGDLDHFKLVNDRWGHPFGDEVLRSAARSLADLVRASDLVARYGGEEFAVLLPDTEPAGGIVLAERMRAGIEALLFTRPDGAPFRISISIGLACQTAGSGWRDSASLLAAADAALYRAKEGGRNRVELAREPTRGE